MIQINQAKKRYGTFQLDLGSIQFPEGQITGLVGTNGSGKTTTFKLLCGLITPDSGQIFIDGQNVDTLSPALKQELGVVLSDSGFLSLLNGQDIEKILKAFYPSFDSNLYSTYMHKLQLPMDKPLSSFSTGMKVRMKLIAALSHQPKILILDEPTAGLDVLGRQEVHQLLQDYMETPGHTIFISSHIASDLEALCDDFWMINDGSLRLHETVDALQNEYGILTLSAQEWQQLDKSAVVAYVPYLEGYQALVKDRHFYEENDPTLVISKGNLDDLILILEKGELL